MNSKPILVFQTDFTYKEGAVSAMYGVVKSVDRSLEIYDSTHEIPQYDTWSASFRLLQTVRFWPSDTIFVSVVDPGVGTKRKACIAKTKRGNYVVTPDNGTLTHLYHDPGIAEVRAIDETRHRLPSTTGTSVFHGRDLFGYCAAKLASGLITFEEVGPVYPVQEIIRHAIPQATYDGQAIRGIFEIMDPNFGNLWTNIPVGMLGDKGIKFGDKVLLQVSHFEKSIFEMEIEYHPTFGYVKQGQPVLYANELLNVAFAICMGSASSVYGLRFGPDWIVTITEVL
jgi:S-adenosylmethionine hydrolase